jgi:hypothetical protein
MPKEARLKGIEVQSSNGKDRNGRTKMRDWEDSSAYQSIYVH